MNDRAVIDRKGDAVEGDLIWHWSIVNHRHGRDEVARLLVEQINGAACGAGRLGDTGRQTLQHLVEDERRASRAGRAEHQRQRLAAVPLFVKQPHILERDGDLIADRDQGGQVVVVERVRFGALNVEDADDRRPHA